MTVALRFNDLTLGYDRHPAVHHLSGSVPVGDLLAVCGPNGAGKSTLLKGIMGALTPIGGKIERTACEPRDIAYLPQAAEVDRSFPIDVFDFVAMGHWRRTGLFGGLSKADRQKVFDAIAAVGLTGLEAVHHHLPRAGDALDVAARLAERDALGVRVHEGESDAGTGLEHARVLDLPSRQVESDRARPLPEEPD